MKKILLTTIGLLCFQTIFSQSTPPTNLTGTTFKTWLKTNWYDSYHNELGYNTARKKMYGYIDNKAGRIYCVYSGFNQPNLFGNEITFPDPINCEHTVPQSFFNYDEPMKSDIHHLFPVHGSWNSTRSNHPFAEIPDNATDKWMLLDNSQTTIPTSSINDYSESESNPINRFEPREDHKGDLARAIFYFYTMYPTQAGAISAVADLSTLCTWHQIDPPSTAEIHRNLDVEFYQGNKNPFISHPEISENAWGCPAFTLAVELVYFQLESQDESVLLNWTSMSEKENAWYEIERGSDEIGFQSIGKIEGAGTTSERSSYQFEDIEPFQGNNYYRLKMVDFEGKIAYSDIEHVQFIKDQAKFALHHYQWNGNQINFKFQSSTNQDAQVVIYDALGRLITQQTIALASGQNEIQMQLPSVLPHGIYYLQLHHRGQNLFTSKINK